MLIESSLKKVLKNSIVILSGNMGANVLGLLSVAIFTHSMGAEIFGYYVLLLTFISVVDKIFNFQTWQAFIKFATDFQVKNEEHNLMMLLKYSFLIDFFSLSVAFIVAFFSVDLFIRFFNVPVEYTNLVKIMTISILFRIFELSTGIFRMFNEFKIQSKILVYVAIIKLIIFGIIALTIPTFVFFIYATIFSQFITFLMKLYYSKQILNKNGVRIINIIKKQINYNLIRELKIFSFIIYNNLDVAVRMISKELDVVLLGKIYGAEVVGLYRIAKEVAGIIAKLTDPIYQAIYPEFARLLANGKKIEAKQVAKKITLYAGLAGIGFYMLFILMGKPAIGLAFGDEFENTYIVVLVYLFAILISVISLPLFPMQHAFGFTKEAFRNQIQTTLLYLPILVFLTSKYEMIGSAISYIIYYIYLTILTTKSVKKGFNNG